jgi:hypothetical protein
LFTSVKDAPMKVRPFLGVAGSLLLSVGVNAGEKPAVPVSTVEAGASKPLGTKFAESQAVDVKRPELKHASAAEPNTADFMAEVRPPLSVYSPLTATDFVDGPKVWANVETLLWWMRPGPLPAMVTRGSNADAIPGALGQPGTRVIYGGGVNDVEYGSQAGFRFNIGGWIDDNHDFGLEFGGIGFRSNNGDSFFADGPNLYVPVTVPGVNAPGTFIVSDPVAGYSGRLNITNEMQLWGMEANALGNFLRSDVWSFSMIGGFRYLDLSERLTMEIYSADTLLGGSLTATDNFRTRNQFYGGQAGIQADMTMGRWFASLRTTVALGATHHTRDARGLSSGDAPPAGTFPNGVFVQPTNSGRYTGGDFSIVPQVGLKLGMDVLPFLRIFAGYDFLYWTNVVRPGNQIDSMVNFSQSFGGTLAGSPHPTPMIRTSDFYAQGLSLGLQLRY